MSLPRFIGYYILYTAVLAGIAIALPYVFPNVNLLAAKFWLVFGFLSVITFIAYILAFIGIKRNPDTGVLAIMASIAIKMIFSMVFVLIYSINAKNSTDPNMNAAGELTKGKDLVFIFNFFSLYLLFTFFEIYGLLRNLRHQNK